MSVAIDHTRLLDLYTIDDDFGDRPKLHSITVQLSRNNAVMRFVGPGTSSGLAFGCRRMFKPGEFAQDEVGAWTRYRDQCLQEARFHQHAHKAACDNSVLASDMLRKLA